MTQSPRVSIGLPVYNGERYLREALDSLRAQTFTDFELIICDNASSDSTEEICRTYAAADGRIRYFRNPANIGVDRNFNRTFELSSGQYFRWAAADDISAPAYVERCVEVLDQRPEVVLCYPKTRYVDEHGNAILDYVDGLNLESPAPNKRFSKCLWNLRMCNAVFGLIRASALKQTELFGVYSNSDLVFLGEMALYGCFYEIPETLFFRRIHEGIAGKKYASLHDRMIMSEPSKSGKLYYPNWKVFGGFLSAIHRSPVHGKEALLCYARMHIWFRRWGRGLIEDLKVAAKYYWGGGNKVAQPNADLTSKPPVP